MGTAAINREYMMDFIGGDEASGLEAFSAKRVLCNVQVTDGAPARTVNFTVVWSVMFIVLAAGDSFVFGTKAFTGDLRTSGI
jgi:hypothetical protein